MPPTSLEKDTPVGPALRKSIERGLIKRKGGGKYTLKASDSLTILRFLYKKYVQRVREGATRGAWVEILKK